MKEYTALLVLKETWPFFAPIFGVKRNFVIELLDGVREIRNTLAHFRGGLSSGQRDRLKFGAQWLGRCQEAYLVGTSFEQTAQLMALFEQYASISESSTVREVFGLYDLNAPTEYGPGAQSGRYTALAHWLQRQPGEVEQILLSLDQIEEIIHASLPASARIQRAWWTNTSAGYGRAQLWQRAGWQVSSIDLMENWVTFRRIRDK